MRRPTSVAASSSMYFRGASTVFTSSLPAGTRGFSALAPFPVGASVGAFERIVRMFAFALALSAAASTGPDADAPPAAAPVELLPETVGRVTYHLAVAPSSVGIAAAPCSGSVMFTWQFDAVAHWAIAGTLACRILIRPNRATF